MRLLHPFPQRVNLPHVMDSMDAVELAPFAGRKRAEHRMKKYILAAAEMLLTPVNRFVQYAQILPDGTPGIARAHAFGH